MKKLDKKRVSARLKRKRMNEEEKIRKVVTKTTIKKINLKRKEDQSELSCMTLEDTHLPNVKSEANYRYIKKTGRGYNQKYRKKEKKIY